MRTFLLTAILTILSIGLSIYYVAEYDNSKEVKEGYFSTFVTHNEDFAMYAFLFGFIASVGTIWVVAQIYESSTCKYEHQQFIEEYKAFKKTLVHLRKEEYFLESHGAFRDIQRINRTIAKHRANINNPWHNWYYSTEIAALEMLE